RERREALELLDDHPPRHRHVARIAPRHLEHGAAHEVFAVEEPEIEVVELQRDLVRLALGVLEGEADEAAAEVERLAAAGLLVRKQRDTHARSAAVDHRVHDAASLRPASPRMTSVSTRRLGITSRRPDSSTRVGSTMGSGWKSAMAHQ